MNPVEFSIREPVKIIVLVLVILLFGIIGFFRMPYQLSPNLSVPQITVSTTWTGATPYEVEREIIEEQEEVFKGIPNLVEMESSAHQGRGRVSLKFKLGTELDDALLRVSNKLNEIRSYPQNVERPVINATGESSSPVIWMLLKTVGDNPRSVYTYRSYFEDEIKQYIERVEGVAELDIRGGTKSEMQITVDPEKLAAYGLTVDDISRVISADNVNVSAGELDVGRRNFRIRMISEFQSEEEIRKTVIKSTGQQRVHISDVAEVGLAYEKKTAVAYINGQEGMSMGVKPVSGTNILELTNQVEKVVNWLNKEKLGPQGLVLHWANDQRSYILGAIKLVRNNIFIGGTLAVLILLFFLQSISSTVIVATAIPISIIGSFIFLNAFGRTMNVISMAGISFAIGMLLDSAIVVLENIDRHRKMGKTPFQASFQGTREVWGAILASSLTTVAVFLPVVFIEEEAGQLFRDIAIAVTCAIMLSLFVSVSVIPSFSHVLISLRKNNERRLKIRKAVRVGSFFVEKIMTLVEFATRTWKTRIGTTVLLTSFSVLVTILLIPKMEYLPQGNRNFVATIMNAPPGLSYEERKEIGDTIFKAASPYMGKEYNGLPGIRELFYVGSESFMYLGAMSTDEQRAGELVPFFTRIINTIPGMLGVSNQTGIFQTRLGGGRTIEVDISGAELEAIVRAAESMMEMIKEEIPETQIRPRPAIELLYPEIRIVPDSDRLKAVDMDATQLGLNLDVLLDGKKTGEFKQEGRKKLDLVLRGSNTIFTTPETLYNALIATPTGKMVPVSSLSTLEQTTGITSIRHFERQRTISLQVTPPKMISLESAMEIIREKLVPLAREQGILTGTDVSLSGEADKLSQTRRALQWDFILAAVIIYLLMSGLFSNFLYPLIILFTLPLAGAGGFIGFKIVNLFTYQPLDILTMLGFVILIGVVVNNAILIVHQSLNNVRYNNLNYRDAVLEATRSRLRPIYMTTFTSIFGMLPLVISPGPGSEIYRGLGSVILGGLAISSIFVIFIIPSLLMFLIKMEK